MDKRERIEGYQQAYLAEYGFEAVMVKYRQRIVLQTVSQIRPRVVVEVGSGADLLCEKVTDYDAFVDKWIIVEPGEYFCNLARQATAPRVHVVQGFLEECISEIKELAGPGPDLVICSGVLHEVPNPAEILTAIATLLATNAMVHINVPNAQSMHRRLAKAMGLIPDTRQITERNRKLAQYRVYDMEMLRHSVDKAGMRVESAGGFLVKPFTHSQMEQISGILTPSILDGLFNLGKELPEIASEIYVNARKVV